MMRGMLRVVCLALLLACCLSTPGTSAGAREARVLRWAQPLLIQKAFRPYGYYSLVGNHPAGFKNFDTIQYWSKRDEQSGPDISERFSGVIADEGAHYRYSTISITRRQFVFNTVKVKGISYSFNGRFLRTDFVNAEMDFDKPVLVGNLRKYRNGRKVAEANVKLSYFAGT
jgi:hypothetical protein